MQQAVFGDVPETANFDFRTISWHTLETSGVVCRAMPSHNKQLL